VAYRLDELGLNDPEAGTIRLRGDGFAAAGEPLTLLENADVHRFLGLSKDEIVRAGEIAARYRAALKEVYAGGTWQPPQLDPAADKARADLARAALALLGRDRFDRFERLSWRIRGADALIDDRVAAALHLTATQRQQLAEAARHNETEQAKGLDTISHVRLRDHRSLQESGVAAHDAGGERLLRILSPAQQKAFAHLLQPRR
jgi:hypothetical protein